MPFRSLGFDIQVESPFGIEVLRTPNCVLYAHVYRPPDPAKVFDLHRNCMASFTNFFHGYGETCAGSFTVPVMGPGWVAEWYAVNLPNRERYWEIMSDIELPLEIQSIVDRGRVMQTASSARYFFWLTPPA